MATGTLSFGRSRDAELGSLRFSSASLTGACCVFRSALITRRPSREAAATHTILTSSTRAPDDTDTSGGTLTGQHDADEKTSASSRTRLPPEIPSSPRGKRPLFLTGRVVRALR